MKYRIFTICCAVSLFMCVAVCALWARSHWTVDRLEGDFINEQSLGTGEWSLESGNGEIRLWSGKMDQPHWFKQIRHVQYTHCPPQDYPWFSSPTGLVAGFAYESGRAEITWVSQTGIRPEDGPLSSVFGQFVSGMSYTLIVPHYAIALLSALLPIIWFRRYLNERRSARVGCCVECGYDLRATPDRCPECGAIPNASKTSKADPAPT